MRLSLYCPSCSRPIGDLHPSSSQAQVTCSFCSTRYGIVYGKLSRCSSIAEALLYLTSKFPGVYKRYYTFQITTADRTLKNLQFSIAGKADPIPAHRGDVVSVLYTMQGYVMKRLVAIANHTTGNHYVLPTPISSASQHAIMLTAIMTGFLVVSCISGINFFLTSLLSALGVLIYLKLAHSARLTSPAIDSLPRQSNRLIADQQLLGQQRKIEQRIHELNHESKSNQMLIEQVETLKQKMSQVDSALYSARIYRATTATNILKKQIANNHRLVREYGRTLKMIEIEIDTSWIADQLPDAENFTRNILERLDELKAIEDQNQSLKLQLTAYEEVKYERIQEYGEGER